MRHDPFLKFSGGIAASRYATLFGEVKYFFQTKEKETAGRKPFKSVETFSKPIYIFSFLARIAPKFSFCQMQEKLGMNFPVFV
jgi:hypothetical protein